MMPTEGPPGPGSVSPRFTPEADARTLMETVERLVEAGYTVEASIRLPSSGTVRISGAAAGGWQGDPLEVAKAESRQYREAFSHAQQLRDFYVTALATLCGARTAAADVRDRAFSEATHALANPPAWDKELRA